MTLTVLDLPVLVEEQAALEALVQVLAFEPRLAVDTESNSLHAYRERVCLIQFSTAQADYLVDPLALDDLNPLGQIFANPGIEKIFHAAEYDLICLRRDFGFEFASLFDTMQAGRILGRKRAGLDLLLEEKFEVKLNKRYQKADWGARPLARDLMLYARLDTHYLIPLRDLLCEELELKGLLPLAQEDFRMACDQNGPKPKAEAPAWTRFSGHRDLTPRDLTVLGELLARREQIAEKLDRPSFKVLEEAKLIALAKTRCTTLEELAGVGLTTKQVQYWGEAFLEAVRRGLHGPPVKREPLIRPDEAYLKRLDKLKKWRKAAAAEMDVESDVVLPRLLLMSLAEHGPEHMLKVMAASPWRLERFGPHILTALGG